MEDDEATCGRGLTHNSAVPAELADAAAGLARNLEVRLRALDPADAASAQELAVYEGVAHSLRGAAAELRAAASAMSEAVDLPMGPHDLAAITATDALDAFAVYVAAEDDLRRLLDARRAENEEMLAAIRAAVGGQDSG